LDVYLLLKKFKAFCERRKGWEAGEEGEWVRDHEGYRAIIWGRSLAPCTFHSMVNNGKISIRRGDFWRVERVKLMIFISEHLPDQLLSEVESSRELRGRAVLYDLARGLRAGGGDHVSAELENFMSKEGGIAFRRLEEREMEAI